MVVDRLSQSPRVCSSPRLVLCVVVHSCFFLPTRLRRESAIFDPCSHVAVVVLPFLPSQSFFENVRDLSAVVRCWSRFQVRLRPSPDETKSSPPCTKAERT